MHRSISTLSDELHRNEVSGRYDAEKAHRKARVRRSDSKYQGMKVVSEKRLRDFVETSLFEGQSPENIAGRIRNVEKGLPTVSKNSVYRFIKSPYGRQIECARAKGKRKGHGRRKKPQTLKDRNFIDARPKSIDERRDIGDVEADFIVSGRNGKGILLVVVDRKTRAVFIEKITLVSVENVHKAFRLIKKRFPEMLTVTTDNDILFRKHKELERLLSVAIYFCHAYHSWEKGTVENTNKHIRKYIFKGSDLSRYSKKCIRSVEEKLNGRFMKCLGHATPNELLMALRKQKIAKMAKDGGVRIEGGL